MVFFFYFIAWIEKDFCVAFVHYGNCVNCENFFCINLYDSLVPELY